MELFSVHKDIIRILKTLDDVGLGYIKLGQLRRRSRAARRSASS